MTICVEENMIGTHLLATINWDVKTITFPMTCWAFLQQMNLRVVPLTHGWWNPYAHTYVCDMRHFYPSKLSLSLREALFRKAYQ
ncbi:hypothetical protein GALMADRAFT_527930 [Galerina marginata CBS 339.88]|uniref:Uncharacterized protein n=1 Tax=Galerina marginata (strain CBS 339.88) TaxID=685588 RepID=A0A067SYG5_GALM3|nr:hypothetical protein GALMADRAFT_527930 [Galerina marginata CBS 339.88]